MREEEGEEETHTETGKRQKEVENREKKVKRRREGMKKVEKRARAR